MPLTVMVVEDDELLRSLTIEVVSMLDVNVVDYASADEALAALDNSSSVALVITDVTMPGSIDGWELANAIWARWPALPIIITSGNKSVPDSLLPLMQRFYKNPGRWTPCIRPSELIFL